MWMCFYNYRVCKRREGVERMMNKAVIYKPQINNHYNFNFVATGVSVCVLKGERERGREGEYLDNYSL